MAHRMSHRLTRQVGHARHRLDQAPGLPMARHLPAETIQKALDQENVSFRDRLFSPCVTLWVFLSQLLDPDHSCRQAVARLVAFRAALGLAPCSPNTSAYCKARQRLSEGVLTRLTRQTGQDLLERAPARWLWKGRTVKIVDGTTVSMPDTPENQQAYPQPRSQKPGLGFPLARLVVVFSLAVGTVLDAALGRYRGKETGETALFRSLHDGLSEGDVVVADRYYGSYFELATLRARGIDLVTRLHQRRRADFRHGERLGSDDHLVLWSKPARPAWMDEGDYARLPPWLLVRETRVHVQQRGFRTKVLVIATTLWDHVQFRRADLAALYRARWQAELDLRSLKNTLQMDILRCTTPEMVRKEVWGHLLAYNLIRAAMAAAAEQEQVEPWEISFKGALQTFNAFLPHLRVAEGEEVARLLREMVKAIGHHRVGDRPDRYEPRAVKRRPKQYPRLTVPRAKARARLAGGG